jgi:hypothetical protein
VEYWTDASGNIIIPEQFIDAVGTNFTASPAFGRPGVAVSFMDTSTNLDVNEPCVFEWDFGDGSARIFSKNAIHTYNTPGNYTVMHWVSGARNTDNPYDRSTNESRILKSIVYSVGEAPAPAVCDP